MFIPDDSKREVPPYISTVRALPQNLKTIWSAATIAASRNKTVRVARLPDAGVVDLAQLSSLVPFIDVYFVDAETADRFGLGPQESSTLSIVPGLEVCRFSCFHNCERLNKALADQAATLDIGKSVAEVWKQFFAPCATLHDSVVLVDRYAIAEAMRLATQSGIFRLANELNSSSSPRFNLSVFSAIPKNVRDAEIGLLLNGLLANLARAGLRQFDLYLTESTAFSRIAHCRYLRFGEQICCVLDPGVCVLEGSSLIRPHMLSGRSFDIVLRRIESDLRTSSRRIKLN
jgi:hypothetical protein